MSAPTKDINRSMPFSDDAEKGVLSCFLQSPNELLNDAQISIPLESFYHPANRLIYETLLEFNSIGKPVDLVALSNYFLDKGMMDKLGGPALLAELFSFVPTTAHYPYYKGILHDKHLLRRIINACTESVQNAYEYQESPLDLLDTVERRILTVRPREHVIKPEKVSTTIMDTVNRIEAVYQGERSSGYSSGFSWLDKMVGGLQSETWFIGARPSVGKTSVALDMIRHLSLERKIRCGFFSMEMSSDLINKRLISSVAEVPLNALKDGSLTRGQMEAVGKSVLLIQKGATVCVDDRAGLTLNQVAAKARRWVRDEGVQIIFLDFLQRMGINTNRKNANRTDEHGENSRGLANLQKELGIPMVCLAQLNRDCEKRDGRPKLSEFEGCGSIEQDADVALLLSRPKEQPGNEDIRHIRFDIAKNRNGPTDDMLHIFERKLASFKPHPIMPGRA